jgi:tetratricopeptide (TPR) repeat protein
MTGLDIPAYIELYKNSWEALVQQMPDVQGYQPGSIQRTRAISFDNIKRQNPLASNLLQLFARFDCHDIWTDLIMNGKRGIDTPAWFQDITKSKVDFLAAIGLLFDFSLLLKGNSTDSFSMHPVVHQWVAMSMRENLCSHVRIAVTAIAFTALVDRETGFWILEKRLLPHADRVYGFVCGPSQLAIGWGPRNNEHASKARDVEEASQQNWTDTQMEHPLRRFGWLYYDLQEFEKAKAIFQLGTHTLQDIHGDEHPLVFRFINCLALVCNSLGDYDEAETLALTALQGFLSRFGKENKWTINALACLPLICHARGEHEKAVKLGEELLSILRTNPDAWPNVLAYTLNNLSIFYSANGQSDNAIEMIKESLNLKFKRLDPDHPDIMSGLENLAGRYMDAGFYTESERVLKQSIDGYARVYGSKSAQATAGKDYLAHLYHRMARLAEAAEIYRNVVHDYETAFGLSHPDTVRCASNLCMAIFQQWETACPFAVGRSRAGPGESTNPFPSQQLVELCSVILKYPGQIDNLGYVAKMLFRYGNIEQSRIILQGQATREAGCWSYTSRSCDSVDSEHLIGSDRFVCMVCDDLDLCRNCRATYKGQKVEGGECIEHPFLDVSIPPSMFSVDLLEEAKGTLTKIIEQYSHADTTTVQVGMSIPERLPPQNASSRANIKPPQGQTLGRRLHKVGLLSRFRSG